MRVFQIAKALGVSSAWVLEFLPEGYRSPAQKIAPTDLRALLMRVSS